MAKTEMMSSVEEMRDRIYEMQLYGRANRWRLTQAGVKTGVVDEIISGLKVEIEPTEFGCFVMMYDRSGIIEKNELIPMMFLAEKIQKLQITDKVISIDFITGDKVVFEAIGN